MKYDYLIIGAGLYGAVCAFELKKLGKSVLVIDKRNHKGGNVYCENIEGINVHKYGAHIFHTNDEKLWRYVNQFCDFNHYVNSPVANFKGKLFNLPFNMNTFYQVWGVKTPVEAREMIDKQINEANIKYPRNLEEQAISMVGTDIYDLLIREYTIKQWGKDPKELPAFIIKRLPLRFTFDNNYFNDRYQGIPIGGYNVIIESLLKDIQIKLNCDYFANRDYFDSIAEKIIYSGPIDQFFDFEYGELEYRSLKFDNEILPIVNYQGNAVVNYTSLDVPFTRIIEHKHFEFGTQPTTVITREYPILSDRNSEKFYPVNDDANSKKFALYDQKRKKIKNVIIGGRLGEYRYYDMHQIIASALKTIENELIS